MLVDVAITALVSGLVSTLVIGTLKRYIDKKLTEASAEKEHLEDIKRRKRLANDDLRRAAGRQFFWMYKQFEHPSTDLQEARQSYNEAEEALKAIDQEIVVDFGRKQ